MDDRAKKNKTLAIIVAIIAAVVISWLVWDQIDDENGDNGQNGTPAVVDEQQNDTDQQQNGAEEQEFPSVTVGEILGDPAPYVGDVVRVDNTLVQDLISEQAFTISDAAQGDELLAVIPGTLPDNESAQAQTLLGEEAARVTVIGEVTQLTVQEVMQRYDAGIPEAVAEAYGTGPILIVQRLEFTDENQSFDIPQSQSGAANDTTQ